jgi:hypothetical protein
VKASDVSPAEAGLFLEETADKEGTRYHGQWRTPYPPVPPASAGGLADAS